MNVLIYSRDDMEKVIEDGKFPENTAVISFFDTYTPIDYSNVCDSVYYCELNDLDIDELEDKGYTYETFFADADKLAEFIYNTYEEGKNIICQCEYGQSRSAGCAAAVLQYFYKTGIDIFTDYRRYPSRLVYHKVFDALNNPSY